MNVIVKQRAYSRGERVVLLVGRVLSAALLTAFVGAIQNWLYERFFAPEQYAAGLPMMRGLGVATLTFPFILAGLILLGLPMAYTLMRVRGENALTYAVVGAGAGALFGKAVIGVATPYGMATSAFYGCTCALFWWWLRPRG